MEGVQVIFVVLGLILVISTAPGWGLKCHQCNTAWYKEGSACEDPITTDDFLRDCPANYTMCRKMTQDVTGDYRVIRQCAKEGRLDRCIERTGTKNIKLKYCECQGDGCNAATSLVSTFTAILSFTATLVALCLRS